MGRQSRKIALKSLAEPSAEALYRLYVIPAKVMQVEQAPQDKITAPMSVAIGYGVLVRHMPPVAKQTTGWTHRCEGREMVLENTGNVRVVLLDARAGTSAEPRNLALFPGVPQHRGWRIALERRRRVALVVMSVIGHQRRRWLRREGALAC